MKKVTWEKRQGLKFEKNSGPSKTQRFRYDSGMREQVDKAETLGMARTHTPMSIREAAEKWKAYQEDRMLEEMERQHALRLRGAMAEHTFEMKKDGGEIMKRVLSDEDVQRLRDFAEKLGRPDWVKGGYAERATYELPHDPEWDKVVDATVGDKFYDAYIDEMPLTVHGGLVGAGQGLIVPDWYWYLWHYGHAAQKDFDVNDADLRKGTVSRVRNEKTGWTRWTLPLILKDAKPAREHFDKLLHLAETVAARELAYEEAVHV